MPRPDVDEVDLGPSISVVNCGSAFSLASLAPVVLGRPVAGELLQRRQLHALRPIFDQLLRRPASPLYAGEDRRTPLRNVDAEGTDLCCGLDGAP